MTGREAVALIRYEIANLEKTIKSLLDQHADKLMEFFDNRLTSLEARLTQTIGEMMEQSMKDCVEDTKTIMAQAIRQYLLNSIAGLEEMRVRMNQETTNADHGQENSNFTNTPIPRPTIPPPIPPASQPQRIVPQYKLNRKVSSLFQIWQEYKNGIHGGPAVEQLEKKWQAKWRTSESERQYFARRKKIYDHIKQLALKRFGDVPEGVDKTARFDELCWEVVKDEDIRREKEKITVSQYKDRL